MRLAPDTNQALGIGQYALEFLKSGKPSDVVLKKTADFHTDSVLCGLSALALCTNAPSVLREEALRYAESDPEHAAFVFSSSQGVKAEKAILANCSAVREWDSNGTNFGYRPELNQTAGEFGHNDFYPVCIAACLQRGFGGRTALLAMVALDEIRGRLAEAFSLKTHKIDHVLHGGIASAAVYGALLGASPEQIESAIGMLVAHYVPWRAIRAGKELSDSKGASAAITTEAAVLCVKRSMAGFRGPRDIFRNPEALFRFFEPTTEERWAEKGDSPFELALSMEGDDFAVMGMHFKIGLYEHQSAGALQGVIDLLVKRPSLAREEIERITIVAYEPAFGIIGNPAKMKPQTRQSADHSMAYIVSTLLRKAREAAELPDSSDELWRALMLSPFDYEVSDSAIHNPATRELMSKVDFSHGGSEYDARYPDGIPTSVVIRAGGREYDSGLVMYPAGHARNTEADLGSLLQRKWEMLGEIALPDGVPVEPVIERLGSLGEMSAFELCGCYDLPLAERAGFNDG